MRNRTVLRAAAVCSLIGVFVGSGPSQPGDDPTLATLRNEAQKLLPLVETEAARAFLGAVDDLPIPKARSIYYPADRSTAYTQSERDALPEAEQAALGERVVNSRFYYLTGYGSPLISVRALDLAAKHLEGSDKGAPLVGKRILDFGYGSIGQLLLEASLGAHVTGVEVQPLFRAMYEGDDGVIAGVDGAPDGELTLVHGRWPAEDGAVGAVRDAQGDGYDLFITKNVLKLGYIHPQREVDPRFLVDLGVDDGAFLDAVHGALKPGGLLMIYNISPKQNPVGERYLPHADGTCPFPHEVLEAHGFEVLAFDVDDQEATLDVWAAVGYDEGAPRDEVAKDLFAWYTLARALPVEDEEPAEKRPSSQYP